MLAQKIFHPSHRSNALRHHQRCISSLPSRVSSSSNISRRRGAILVRTADEVKVEFDLAVPLSSPQGSQLAYILSNGEGSELLMFEPAVKTYLTELQQERDAEAAMEAEAAADAAAEAAAAAAAASESGEGQGAVDASSTWDDAELMRRIRAVREAERGQVVADILYLEVARQLQAAGMQLLNNLALLSPNISQPPPDFMSAERLQQQQQQQSEDSSSSSSSSGWVSPAVADAIVSYLASTFEGGDARMMDAAAPPVTPLSVDRLQAARLYCGLLEFGYFAAALEARCRTVGIQIGSDSAAMIAHADSLPEDELRRMCAVQSADGWWGAVRHVGTIFGLAPNADAFDSFGLPFPDLAVTISQIQEATQVWNIGCLNPLSRHSKRWAGHTGSEQPPSSMVQRVQFLASSLGTTAATMEPAANLLEHFNTPGTAARLAARSTEQDPPLEGSLPDANLVSFELGLFRRLLLEAAVYGALLFGVEQQVERQYSYKLSCRREREAHAGQPPL
ncbi:hypothetical protein OEZ86_003645 [Tetradesmus obliquus]|nr:hypothetical protein OEZ86_003645 [Tetradesmus obliquus]